MLVRCSTQSIVGVLFNRDPQPSTNEPNAGTASHETIDSIDHNRKPNILALVCQGQRDTTSVVVELTSFCILCQGVNHYTHLIRNEDVQGICGQKTNSNQQRSELKSFVVDGPKIGKEDLQC